MRQFVAVVICAASVVPAGASATGPSLAVLRQAERASGLHARRPIRVLVERAPRYDADRARVLERDYPRRLRELDDRLYAGLGLSAATEDISTKLTARARASNAVYDPVARVLRLRARPAPAREELVHEVVRALVDQNVGLRRLTGLRGRDRDRALAANAMVDAVAAAASGRRSPALAGTPLDRFLSVELTAGAGPGRRLVSQLRSIGGTFALLSALRTFPQTTEQLLHVDKFLQRERALPIVLPTHADDRAVSTTATLSASETFGELDVRALLLTFALPEPERVADGWGGGRLALYVGAAGGPPTVLLVLRWDTPADAAEWRAVVGRLVAAAFPTAQARVCPAVDRCWLVGDREIAAASAGDVTAVASGPAGELVAATVARSNR